MQPENPLGLASSSGEAAVKYLTLDKSSLKETPKMGIFLVSHCLTCYLLDARKAPKETDDGWTALEYNVPASTHSRMLSIKHTQLLASSASECIYCIVVCQSLSQVRPRWKTEKSIVVVFLAPNLPVAVRWIKGSGFDTKPVWEDVAGGYVKHNI